MSASIQKPWLKMYEKGFPHELPLPTLTPIDQFRETVKRSPDFPAVHYFDTTITFDEINQYSNGLAAGLQELGVGTGDRVALFMQNIPQFWIANLAAWKIGAIIVPLNIMFKEKELIYHLNDSGATVLISMETSFVEVAKEALQYTSVKHVITTSELDLLDQMVRPEVLNASTKLTGLDTIDFLELCKRYREAADPKVKVDLDGVAMLVYTSGTTGDPKGAMITFGNISFNAETYRRWMQIDEQDVIVAGAPLFHITGLIAHLALAAVSGIPIILTYRFDAGELLRLIEKWKGSFSVMAITAYMALLNHKDLKERNIKSLQKVYSGGAPIPQSIVKQFKEKTGAYIHGVYGLTETTSPTHAVPYGSNAEVNEEFSVLSVGVPVPNCVSKVVDSMTGEELLPGEVGEIVVKGPMVVSGYWNKPEATAKAIKDGWFYTGDVGLMDYNGWFYVIDRTKDMIIASGYKVWPREVEDVIYQHPAVREAAVIGVEDLYRGETVKAYVSLVEGKEATPEEIISFCKQRLAAYKYPRKVEIIDEVPKTATGKFLRRVLRDRLQAEIEK